MKRLFAAALAAITSLAFGATTIPPSMINPSGSTAGQVVISTGPTTQPVWSTVSSIAPPAGSVSYAALTNAPANSVLGNVTGSTAAVVANSLPSCSSTSSALQYTSGAGFGCGTLSGRLLNVQVLTSASCSAGCTYTATTGTGKVIVEFQAPGGGGGGCGSTAAGQSCAAGGGGSGSYAKVLFTSGFSGVTVTLPTGGAAAAAGQNNGTTGSTATFGSLISCPGGTGGSGSGGSSSALISNPSGSIGSCTISGGTALFTTFGMQGAPGLILTPGTYSWSGVGGNSIWGMGGISRTGSGAGIAGGGFGAGGGAANSGASQGTFAGSAGQGAAAIIYEYSN